MTSAKLMGGLGNQIFMMAAATALALRNNTEAVFDLEKCSTELQGNAAEKYRDNFYRNVKSASIALEGANIYKEPKFTFDEIPYSENLILEGYFQSEKYFADCKPHIRSMFHFEPERKERIQEYLNSVGVDKPITTIHIRRGDYLKFPDVYYVCDKEYYERAMAELPGNNFVFVAYGKDMDWVKENFSGENIFYSPFTEELDDLTLLSMGDNNIIANSTFSWWGAWFNPNQNKKVIAPKDWFKPQYNTSAEDMYCDGWLVI